jgi:hypothetical protein
LSEAIELSLLPAGFRQPDFKPIEKLSNREVLRLTRLQMTQAEDRRLSRLLYCQQAGKLGHQERVELLALMQAYGVGLMRKAQALKEGVRRGFRLSFPESPDMTETAKKG